MVGTDGFAKPVTLKGVQVLPPVLGFLSDPLRTADRVSKTHGDFVILRFPFAVGRMPRTVVYTAMAPHFREILGDPASWRTVNILAAGRGGHASSRLSRGLVRMRGDRHGHYRRLVTPRLRRASVSAMGESLGSEAERICESWPRDRTVDLYALCRNMMQQLAAGHLFGSGEEQACAIARMISSFVSASWSLPINLFHLDLPGMPYRRFLRLAEDLEERILEWAETKQGGLDPTDLLSIVVNNPDENGRRPENSLIVGHVPTLFGAAYETCQNALTWLLILLSQHPRIEGALCEEITAAVGGRALTLERVEGLQFLDSVVKEGLRILPPVPNQYRVATRDAHLGGVSVARGTRAILSAFMRNRDPDFYEAADRFLPERWENLEPSPFEYAVFSAGPRSCPGFGFGSSVLKLALAAILSRHRVVIEEQAEIGYRVTVALTPYPGVPARLAARGTSVGMSEIRGPIRRLVSFPT